MSKEIETVKMRSSYGKESNSYETYYNWNHKLKEQFSRTDTKREFVIQRNNHQRKKYHREKKDGHYQKGIWTMGWMMNRIKRCNICNWCSKRTK